MADEKPNFYDLYSKVGNIEGKLDSFCDTMKKHEDRLNTVERVQDQMVGKISVSATIFGFIGGIITTVFGWFLTNK